MKYQVLFSMENNEKKYFWMPSAAAVFGALRVKAPKMKIVEFANSIDPDEAAHNELPHLDLHFLSSILCSLTLV